MCDIMEAAIQEAREEARKEAEMAKLAAEKAIADAKKAIESIKEHKRFMIEKLLDKTNMSYEEIAEIVSGTVAEVEEAAKLKAEQTCVFERP